MRTAAGFAIVFVLGACTFRPSPESVFRAKTPPNEMTITGELAVGTHVTFADVDLEVLEAFTTRRDDELVSASTRAVLDDVAVGAAAVSVTAKAAAPKSEDAKTVSDGASQVARVAAVASTLGALLAAKEETSESALRIKVGDRTWRATCASTDKRGVFDPYARPSLSCAIVPVVAEPTRHWALVVRSTTGGLAPPKHEGFVEARTARGRDEAAPILRLASSPTYSMVTGANGKEEMIMQYNASFEVMTPSGHVAALRTRSYGGKPTAWIDTSSLADAEARDAAAISVAILGLFRWPEIDDRSGR